MMYVREYNCFLDLYLTIWLNKGMNRKDSLSLVFSALGDPTRRSILQRLSKGHLSVTELSEPYKMSLPAITKHLKVLEKAGLISRGKEAQWRPCQLEAGALIEASDWISYYREFWEESFNRLENYLNEYQTKKSKGNSHGKTKKRK